MVCFKLYTHSRRSTSVWKWWCGIAFDMVQCVTGEYQLKTFWQTSFVIRRYLQLTFQCLQHTVPSDMKSPRTVHIVSAVKGFPSLILIWMHKVKRFSCFGKWNHWYCHILGEGKVAQKFVCFLVEVIIAWVCNCTALVKNLRSFEITVWGTKMLMFSFPPKNVPSLLCHCQDLALFNQLLQHASYAPRFSAVNAMI